MPRRRITMLSPDSLAAQADVTGEAGGADLVRDNGQAAFAREVERAEFARERLRKAREAYREKRGITVPIPDLWCDDSTSTAPPGTATGAATATARTTHR